MPHITIEQQADILVKRLDEYERWFRTGKEVGPCPFPCDNLLCSVKSWEREELMRVGAPTCVLDMCEPLRGPNRGRAIARGSHFSYMDMSSEARRKIVLSWYRRMISKGNVRLTKARSPYRIYGARNLMPEGSEYAL